MWTFLGLLGWEGMVFLASATLSVSVCACERGVWEAVGARPPVSTLQTEWTHRTALEEHGAPVSPAPTFFLPCCPGRPGGAAV